MNSDIGICFNILKKDKIITKKQNNYCTVAQSVILLTNKFLNKFLRNLKIEMLYLGNITMHGLIALA